MQTAPEERATQRVGAWRIIPPLYIVLGYLAGGFILLRPFQYLLYKDEISYVVAAESYARGDLLTAPNALWSPLLSWCLAVPLSMGLPVELTAKLLSLLIGLFALFATQLLFRTFGVDGRIRIWLSLVLVPNVLYFALIFFTPDLLLAGLLAVYFSVVLRPSALDKLATGLLCGFVGALIYFCKGYGFYFFLGHFALVATVCVIIAKGTSRKMAVLRNYSAGLLVFIALSGGWIWLLYRKYHEVTPGVAGRYNFAIVGPDSPGRPLAYAGLIPPPRHVTVSVWEDPYYLYRLVRPWSPFDSRPAFIHQLKILMENWWITIDAYQTFSLFSTTIIVAVLLLCLGPSLSATRVMLGISLATLALYPAGYGLIHNEQRYLWPMHFLLITLGGYVLQQLWNMEWFSFRRKNVLSATMLAISFLIAPLSGLVRGANNGQTLHTLGVALNGVGLHGARIASDSDDNATIFLAYYVGAKYYGMPKRNQASADKVAELRRHSIDYYLVWDGAPIYGEALVKRNEFNAGGRTLTIYAVTANST